MSNKKKVVISGGTGLIGQHVCQNSNDAYEIFIISRKGQSGNPNIISWEDEEKLLSVLNDAYAIIHLAGAPIAKWPWTKSHERNIYQSRVDLTQKLTDLINKLEKRPRCLIQISATGIYPPVAQNATENGRIIRYNMIQDLVSDWEMASENLDPRIRKVILRVGMVLSNEGGALPSLMLPFKYYFGGHVGSGKQNVPWIHIEDLTSMILYAVTEDKLKGVYNAVAPEPITMGNLVNEIAVLRKQSSWLHMPEWAAKLILGKMAKYLLLVDHSVSADKIIKAGFTYQFSAVKGALKNLIS